MRKRLLVILTITLAALAPAADFQWNDNSDNEEGFELRGTDKQGATHVVASTVANVTRLSVPDTSQWASVQVFAWNYDWDNNKQYSGGSNVLAKPTKPIAAEKLRTAPRQASARYNPRRGR